MKKLLNYKGYNGTAEICMDTHCVHGHIMFIADLVTYEADSPKELQKVFEESVDDYLLTCKELGREPQKPCSGSFNVRISPELHRQAVLKANIQDTSLNAIVACALEQYVTDDGGYKHISDTIKTSVTEIANRYLWASLEFKEIVANKPPVVTAAPKSHQIGGLQLVTTNFGNFKMAMNS